MVHRYAAAVGASADKNRSARRMPLASDFRLR